jgi:superfamily II RNA helicase
VSLPLLDLNNLFPFKLDDFQLAAIAALEADKSVVVCAPTGSGKTVIGEYAMYRALARGKRIFYTTPLKALSNQKVRDFQEKLRQQSLRDWETTVGLITGDLVINANAPIVVMTTEIFRNMLYETPIGEVGTSLEEVETVVFDECHYISDRDRGTVWEESIIYCPASIQLVALSATIGNPEQLTDWINQVRKGKSLKQIRRQEVDESQNHCELINSDFRPVPLHFHFSAKNGLFPLLNTQKTGVNPQLLPKKQAHNPKKNRLRREDCPSVLTVVEQLRERDFLPAIYVIFSRRGCEQAVQELRHLTLVSTAESHIIQLTLLSFFLGHNRNLRESFKTDFGHSFPELTAQILTFLESPQTEAEALLENLTTQPEQTLRLWQWLAQSSPMTRFEQIEPLIRGIAVHHAGVLPSWKELVEQLFEQGLIKVVFATATLSAGINMPARTTIISALSKRTDEGHAMLSPSEFLQMAGRAGRRGMDEAGQVVTVQTPFEGPKEASFLAMAEAEPLRSWFTPSYGMVLNLLQKHSLEQAKDLLERSFAEYLMQLALEPTQEAIAQLLSQIAQLDFKLAGVKETDIRSYEKFRARLREEERLLKTLEQQAEKAKRQDIVPYLSQIEPGEILHLKGKFIKVSPPVLAIFIATLPGFSKVPELLCLGADNRWYRTAASDVFAINGAKLVGFPLTSLPLPPLDSLLLGKPQKGTPETAIAAQQIAPIALPLTVPTEILEQQQRVNHVRQILETHPLQHHKQPSRAIEQYHQRLSLREELEKRQHDLVRLQSRQSYYWQEFLDLIAILQELEALDEFLPTPLGEAAATLRGENELWLGLVLMSGKFTNLAPHQLAAAMSGLITETLRPDTWSRYAPPPDVLAALRPSQDLHLLYFLLRFPAIVNLTLWELGILAYYLGRTNLWEVRRKLIQSQKRYAITIPLWLEVELLGLVEQWALGITWDELCRQTSLDEGDLVRLLRRTIDLLWQVPQVPHISETLKRNAKQAVAMMKRFPI